MEKVCSNMTNDQISLYEGLPEEEKNILKIAVLITKGINPDTLARGLQYVGKKFKVQTLKAVLESANQNGFLENIDTWTRGYSVHPDFLGYVYPSTGNLLGVAKTIFNSNTYYSSYYLGQDSLVLFRNCLHSLLYGTEEEYQQDESKLLLHSWGNSEYYIRYLFKNASYVNYFHRINPRIFSVYLDSEMRSAQVSFLPLSSVLELLVDLNKHLKISLDEKKILQKTYFLRGELEKALDLTNPKMEMEVLYVSAIKMLAEDKVMEATKLFEKGLKVQRRDYKGTYIPLLADMAIFYLIALLRGGLEESMPLFQKIADSFDKAMGESVNVFRPLVNFTLGKKDAAALNRTELEAYVGDDSILSFISIIVFYLSDFKWNNKLKLGPLKQTLKRASDNDHLILAYEAAYALKQLLGDDESNKLFDAIAKKMSYQPLLSKLSKTEDWEKSLNLLLGLRNRKKAVQNGEEEKNRIVYFFNPKTKIIQPVLQTKQVKGWSKGRNVSMKTFFQGKVAGMKEQDFHVAKTMRPDPYYYDSYQFKDDVFKELIGHPYLYLDGTDYIPVEFIAGKPLVSVDKTAKGYLLKTDLVVKDVEKILIEKETNTRYKVYELAPQQRTILNILQEQKIIVPQAGKDKLIQLLADFTSQGMEVHSDLAATPSSSLAVKEVVADAKIYVQLLPFGNGLKAELFSKPFAETPPYCKPGKGGKVLFRNADGGMQLQVKRKMEQELANEQTLMNDIQGLESLDIQDSLIAFEDPKDSLYLLDILHKHQEISVVEWPEGVRYKMRAAVGFGNLSMKVKSATSWFELQGELKVDEETVVSLQQLLSMTQQAHGKFVQLSDGEFLALSDELRKRLDDLRAFSVSDKKGVRVNKLASIALGGLFDEVEDFKADKSWQDFNKRIRENQAKEVAVPSTLMAELRSYQEEGFRWMSQLAAWEGGACLADDMGLGKTIQAIAVLLSRANMGTALVVCPVSVIGNWISEINRFAPTLNVNTLGNSNRKQTLHELSEGDVLVTSYGLLQSEEALFAEASFATLVLDEAHAIKNFATKTSKAIMQLKSSFRIALTGTPIQNHLGEIWNIFNFLNPGLLGSLQQFTDRFIKPEDERARKQLKHLISPFILRRTKSKVLDELPPKTEILKKIQLSDQETAFYEALRRKALEVITGAEGNNGAKHLQVLAEITKLRQACCNPLLVDKNIRIPSSKLETFKEIIGELTESGHRALVFSQFVSHLAIVREALDEMHISYQYLDGSTPTAEREKRVKSFQGGEGNLFLISLKAGGLGLNLTAADYVIHLDPWWNPAIEDQASDRAHRIGQQRPVTVYRLVAENTIEEKIIQLHSTKRDLADSLLEGSDQAARLSLQELMALIGENQ